jgi:site-specific recombinase XerD
MTKPITPLRQRMIDDMALRNMSPATQRVYINAVKNFSAFFGRSPDKLTFEDVRTYQLHLVSRGLKPTTIHPILYALRFFYRTTLGRSGVTEQISPPRRPDPLPTVLAPEEIVRFLKAVPGLKPRTALTTVYATGLRVAEAVSLTRTSIAPGWSFMSGMAKEAEIAM